MIHLRRILHPFGYLRSFYKRAGLYAYRRFAKRRFNNIRRGRRDRCWCGKELLPFSWHRNYGVCAECGSYVNRYPPLPRELNKVYSLDFYWRARQKMKGYPPIEGRADLYESDGRLGYWLALIERYGPNQGQVIEVGCAPGILLAELQKRAYECIGVEADGKVADWIQRSMKVEVRPGLFPGVKLPRCDLFLAFDVIEHSPDPEAFLKNAAQLLNPDGVAIIQTPIDRYDYRPPFGERFKDAFDDIEHLYLFTDKAMQELAQRSGLKILSVTEGLWLCHEIVVLEKKRLAT